MRLLSRSVLVTAMAAAAIVTSSVTARAAVCGDLNNSGGATPRSIADVVLLFRTVLENPDPSPICGGAGALDCGDINDDGSISIADVVILFSSVLGSETLFPLCVGKGPTIPCPGGSQTITANITGNQVWPAGCTILLDGTIFVQPGVVLTIDPGATIFGKRNPTNPPPTALVFRRDSKINAVGTEASPIVFSSDQPEGSKAAGDWAGVALNGRGPVNCPGNECDAEGLVNVPFGGTETNDSSGIARFIRVEFAGRELATDNELNVWTMNGVGRGTTMDHIHAHMGLDDGHEWFGGNVNSRFMLASGAADDLLDWQIGFTGATQFAAGLQYGVNLDPEGSRGFEGDNNEDGFELTPRSNPQFCNVTLMGAKGQGGGANDEQCMRLRRGTAAQIWQTICFNWTTSGVSVRDTSTFNVACEPNGTQNLSGDLMFKESIIFDVGAGSPGTTYCDQNNAGDCNDSNDLCNMWDDAPNALKKGADPGMPGGCGTTPGCIPVPSSAAVDSTFNCSAIDPFLQNVDYIGAFDPDGDANGWANPPWVDLDLD